jgi:hypothetical protein
MDDFDASQEVRKLEIQSADEARQVVNKLYRDWNLGEGKWSHTSDARSDEEKKMEQLKVIQRLSFSDYYLAIVVQNCRSELSFRIVVQQLLWQVFSGDCRPAILIQRLSLTGRICGSIV